MTPARGSSERYIHPTDEKMSVVVVAASRADGRRCASVPVTTDGGVETTGSFSAPSIHWTPRGGDDLRERPSSPRQVRSSSSFDQVRRVGLNQKGRSRLSAQAASEPARRQSAWKEELEKLHLSAEIKCNLFSTHQTGSVSADLGHPAENPEVELSAQGEGDSKVVGPQEKVGLPFGRRVENLFFPIHGDQSPLPDGFGFGSPG